MYACCVAAVAAIVGEIYVNVRPAGIQHAEDLKDKFPDQYATMMANADNSYQTDYLQEDPYLVNIYEGYGFAKDYMSARGHSYDLEDVHETARPHPKANCLTCKSSDFTKLVNDQGDAAYTMDFEEVYASLTEGISCYNCHENQTADGGKLVVTHKYLSDALGENMESFDPVNLSCGQCHTEYYFKQETLVATVPYSSKETMGPANELAYYNATGFADWTNEATGAAMLKVQHPEFETVSLHAHGSMINCATCHMEEITRSDGSTYTSHTWVSPLGNEAIMQRCVQCHGDTDMEAVVRGIQEEITAREDVVGQELSDFKDALAAANQGGTKSEAELEELRQIYRDAQWYFDYDYVENSEGAHNPGLARECLDTSEKMIQEGMEKLGASDT